MNTTGPVLRDIHLPPASWWPLAPGWWLLGGAALLGLVALVWWRRRRTPPLLAVALREIDAMASACRTDADAGTLVDAASRLLRRIALRVQPAVASESGAAWRAFVHAHAGDAATRAALDALLDSRFRARPQVDAATLTPALRRWCGDALRARTSFGLRRLK